MKVRQKKNLLAPNRPQSSECIALRRKSKMAFIISTYDSINTLIAFSDAIIVTSNQALQKKANEKRRKNKHKYTALIQGGRCDLNKFS